MASKTDQMQEVHDAVVSLRGSELAQTRREGGWLPVIGEGSYAASIMFVGEAPGKNEAEQGRPFCGASGRILDELLASVGIAREEVYVTNVVKDRPPLNRDPSPEEIQLYGPLLRRQIEILQPKVLATLGRFAMQWAMRNYDLEESIEPIGKLHGKAFETMNDSAKMVVLPLFHPAVALYNANQKETLLKDFKQLSAYA